MPKETTGRDSALTLELLRNIGAGDLSISVKLLSWPNYIVGIQLLLVVVKDDLLLDKIIVVVFHVLNDILICLSDYVLVADIDFVLIAAASSS